MRVALGVLFGVGGLYLTYLVLSGKFPNADAVLVNPQNQQNTGASNSGTPPVANPFSQYSNGLRASTGGFHH